MVHVGKHAGGLNPVDQSSLWADFSESWSNSVSTEIGVSAFTQSIRSSSSASLVLCGQCQDC